MNTLGDDYPRQQARMRILRDQGLALGPVGFFYAAQADDILRRADEAAISGDLTAMIGVYQEMKEFKE